MAIWTSADDQMNSFTVDESTNEWSFNKPVGPSAEAAGSWTSLWGAIGSPAAGSNPATTPGAALDNDGGSIWWADCANDNRAVVVFEGAMTVGGTLALDDRLVGVSGIALSSTGDKTVSSAALTRYTGTASAVVEAWVEVTTQTATTAPIISMNSYTDQDNNSGSAGGSLTFPATVTDVRWMGRLPMASGDQGLRAISTINVATAATAGVCNVWLLKNIMLLPLVANVWNIRAVNLEASFGPSRIYNGHSLALRYLASSTTAVGCYGRVVVGHKD